MKKPTVFCFSLLTALGLFNFTEATAQTKVREADIVRQAENTPPTGNWVAYTRNAGTVNFMQGPGTNPSGCGSLQFNTPISADKAFLYNYDWNNTPLAAITAISYATYQAIGSAIQVPGLNIEIDANGPNLPGGTAILVFEPVYNSEQGAIVSNTWQTWNAFNIGNAKWWSTQPIPGVCASDCFVTWNQILISNPDAVISGGIGINQGSGNAGLVSAADNFTIGKTGLTKTYDFEPKNCSNTNLATTYQLNPTDPTVNTLLAYPNPTAGEVNLRLPVIKAAKADITIMNGNGTVVESRTAKTEGQVEQFDLSTAGPGLYLIKVTSPNTVEYSKVMVQ